MKNCFKRSLLLSGSIGRHGRQAARSFIALSRAFTVLCVGIAMIGSTQVSHADPVRIFHYISGGVTEVTSSCSYQEHHIFDSLGNLIGTVDAAGYTYDLSGQQTGYVILIYLYSANGTLTEVTSSYHYQEPNVFDLAGNVLGNVDAAGTITNAANVVIGHMTFVPAQ